MTQGLEKRGIQLHNVVKKYIDIIDMRDHMDEKVPVK